MSDDFFESEVSTGGMTADTAHDGGGNYVDAEGRFHVSIASVEINAADPEAKKLPHIKCQMTVHAGEVVTQVDKSLITRVYLANWADKENGEMAPLAEAAGKGLLAFLHAFGVIGDEAFSGDSVKLSRAMFERLENCQAIIKVTKGKDREVTKDDGEKVVYPGRYEMQWSNDCWPLGHEKVKDVPKDMVLANAAGVDTGDSVADDLDDI